MIYGILEDNNGNIWFSTNKGLTQFNPVKNEFYNFTMSDGLQSNEFNLGVCHKGADGELLFGGVNGYNAFYPEQLKRNLYIPPIRLTGFKIFNKSVQLDTAIQFKKKIMLSHYQSMFSFEFAALNFINPEKNQYAYKMEGLYDDWIQLNHGRTVSFTHLDPGNYVFRVKGSNNHGIWNEAGTSIRVTITPPFWQTIWFRMIFGIIIYRSRNRFIFALLAENVHPCIYTYLL